MSGKFKIRIICGLVNPTNREVMRSTAIDGYEVIATYKDYNTLKVKELRNVIDSNRNREIQEILHHAKEFHSIYKVHDYRTLVDLPTEVFGSFTGVKNEDIAILATELFNAYFPDYEG